MVEWNWIGHSRYTKNKRAELVERSEAEKKLAEKDKLIRRYGRDHCMQPWGPSCPNGCPLYDICKEKKDTPRPSEKPEDDKKFNINNSDDDKCRYDEGNSKCSLWPDNKPPNACLACNSFTPKNTKEK